MKNKFFIPITATGLLFLFATSLFCGCNEDNDDEDAQSTTFCIEINGGGVDSIRIRA